MPKATHPLSAEGTTILHTPGFWALPVDHFCIACFQVNASQQFVEAGSSGAMIRRVAGHYSMLHVDEQAADRSPPQQVSGSCIEVLAQSTRSSWLHGPTAHSLLGEIVRLETLTSSRSTNPLALQQCLLPCHYNHIIDVLDASVIQWCAQNSGH